ncbi:MAG: Fic family protein [Treponema sp.]|nr:Fic family protein [Treponema sp.]
MIENPPKNTKSSSQNIIDILIDPQNQEQFQKIEKDYLYWDKAKYYKPKNTDDADFWNAIKISRIGELISFGKRLFKFKITTHMQKFLHEFDMNFGGTLLTSDTISEKKKQYYLLSSLMEEAIASSQMEGANTTRKVAKDMLRKQAKPKNIDQQMIVNNYNTIRFLVEQKDKNFSPELLLEIHKMISENTLENHEDEGKFRTSDNIVVMDSLKGEIAHTPPSYTEINTYIDDLCNFANNDEKYIHPIVKAIIIHFIISYLHPFVDGNGRTARSLFYWYMLKKGYWLTEFLSISRIIYRSKNRYEKAFLYVENDELDLGYFINYNLNVLQQSFNELKIYLNKKTNEEKSLFDFKFIKGINERQAQIIKMCIEKPSTIFIAKELETTFNVSVKTIRNDLIGLVQLGILDSLAINQRLTGYTRVQNLEEKLNHFRGN